MNQIQEDICFMSLLMTTGSFTFTNSDSVKMQCTATFGNNSDNLVCLTIVKNAYQKRETTKTLHFDTDLLRQEGGSSAIHQK